MFHLFIHILPPIALIFSVLGSIFLGIATPTESAAVGAIGALLIALIKKRTQITAQLNRMANFDKKFAFLLPEIF